MAGLNDDDWTNSTSGAVAFFDNSLEVWRYIADSTTGMLSMILVGCVQMVGTCRQMTSGKF